MSSPPVPEGGSVLAQQRSDEGRGDNQQHLSSGYSRHQIHADSDSWGDFPQQMQSDFGFSLPASTHNPSPAYPPDSLQELSYCAQSEDQQQPLATAEALKGGEDQVQRPFIQNTQMYCSDTHSVHDGKQLRRHRHGDEILRHQQAAGLDQYQDALSKNPIRSELHHATTDIGTTKRSRLSLQSISESPSFRAVLTKKVAITACAISKTPDPHTSNEHPKQQKQIHLKKKGIKTYNEFFKGMPSAEVGWRLPEPLDKLNFTMVEMIVLTPKLFQNFVVGIRFQSNGISQALHQFILCRHKNDDAKGLRENDICLPVCNPKVDWGKIIAQDRDALPINSVCVGYERSIRKRAENKWHDRYGHDDRKNWTKWIHAKHATEYKLPDWDVKHAHEVSMHYYSTSAAEARPIPFGQLRTKINVLPQGPDVGDLTKALLYVLEHPKDEDGNDWMFPTDIHRVLDKCGRAIITDEHRDPAAVQRWLDIMESVGGNENYQNTKTPKRKRDEDQEPVIQPPIQVRRLVNSSLSTSDVPERNDEEQTNDESTPSPTVVQSSTPSPVPSSETESSPPQADHEEAFEKWLDTYHDRVDANSIQAEFPCQDTQSLEGIGEVADLDDTVFHQILDQELASLDRPHLDRLFQDFMPQEAESQDRGNKAAEQAESFWMANQLGDGLQLADLLQPAEEQPDSRPEFANETFESIPDLNDFPYTAQQQQAIDDWVLGQFPSGDVAHDSQLHPTYSNGNISMSFADSVPATYPLLQHQFQVQNTAQHPTDSAGWDHQLYNNDTAFTPVDNSRLIPNNAAAPSRFPTQSWQSEFLEDTVCDDDVRMEEIAQTYDLSFDS